MVDNNGMNNNYQKGTQKKDYVVVTQYTTFTSLWKDVTDWLFLTLTSSSGSGTSSVDDSGSSSGSSSSSASSSTTTVLNTMQTSSPTTSTTSHVAEFFHQLMIGNNNNDDDDDNNDNNVTTLSTPSMMVTNNNECSFVDVEVGTEEDDVMETPSNDGYNRILTTHIEKLVLQPLCKLFLERWYQQQQQQQYQQLSLCTDGAVQQLEVHNMVLVSACLVSIFLLWSIYYVYCCYRRLSTTQQKGTSHRKKAVRRQRSIKQRGSEIFDSTGRSLALEAVGNHHFNTEVDGMEILRAGPSAAVGRGRFRTFDFFGMNHYGTTTGGGGGGTSRGHHRSRGRTASADSLDAAMDSQRTTTAIVGGPNITDSRRDRLGSMDVYYARGGGTSVGRGLDVNDSTHDRSRKGKSRSLSEETPRGGGGAGGRGFRVQTEPHLSSPAVIDDNRGGELYLHDEFGIVTLSHRVTYYGPSQTSLKYSTLTPPTSWAEASRRIIPTAIMTKLQRRLLLNVMESKVEIKEPTSAGGWDFSLSTEDVSIHVQRPLEAGVLSLYVKGTPKEEWMEHTFETAQSAAQFQLDLLAFQVLGKSLRNAFDALNLVHQGSIAYGGQEYVLHDGHRSSNKDDGSDNPPPTKSGAASRCVAWDDAMRAMSSIPTVRIALERLWLTHRHPSNIAESFGRKRKDRKLKDLNVIDIDDKGTEDHGLLTGEYLGKRLLLGPIDFFRLFVPALPETAIPEGGSNRIRMEQLLSWRKRVARAAVLVRYYTRAHRITNLGWNLTPGDCAGTTNKIVKRLAYDGNDDNNVRDTATKNEIYEASVSRDVLCYVRPFDYLSDPEETNHMDQSIKQLVLSPYQAYSFVGSQYFKLTEELIEEGAPLHPSRDPVDVFPSLKALVSRNPDLDFFITAFTNPNTLVLFVNVFVRSLAKGIDPQFDNVINRYSNGTVESRESKLFLMFQLGNRMGLSFGGWLFLRLLAFLFQLFQTGRDSPISLESTRDRHAFPAVKVSSFFRTFHFGGALQTDQDKPSNYIAMNSLLTTSFMPDQISRMLFSRIDGHVPDSITDFTYVIEGEYEDELPERALATIRHVHVNPESVARDPIPHITLPDGSSNVVRFDIHPHGYRNDSIYAFGRAVTGTLEKMVAIVRTPLRSRLGGSPLYGHHGNDKASENGNDSDDSIGLPRQLLVINEDGDAFEPTERAVADVMDILHAIKVPSRLSADNLSVVKLETLDNKLPKQTEDARLTVTTLMPVLDIVDRYDIERYIRACDFDLHAASLRLVETAAWRGRTFPIDKRRCRIELQNGQFFQQGLDKENNPVFYFRNMGRGPWRMDEDAVISSILYRFDRSLREFCKSNPFTKVTIIILMGTPRSRTTTKKRKGGVESEVSEATSTEGDVSVADDGSNGVGDTGTVDNGDPDAGSGGDSTITSSGDDDVTDDAAAKSGNPRISPNEHWTIHSNEQLMERMFGILAEHYPSRLAKALIVMARGSKTPFFRDSASRKLKKVLSKQLTQDKIWFVAKPSQLAKVVDVKQLVTIVGGKGSIDDSAYDF